jgi:large subunit ribosomal protein L32
MRRAHHDKVARPGIVPCPKCDDMMLPHRVCPSCGYYKGREVVAKKEKKQKQQPTAGETA